MKRALRLTRCGWPHWKRRCGSTPIRRGWPSASPTVRALAGQRARSRQLAERLLPVVAKAIGSQLRSASSRCADQIGSGALPVDLLPSFRHRRARQGLGSHWPRRSAAADSVIGRISDGALCLRPAHARRRGGVREPTGQARMSWLGQMLRRRRAPDGPGARRLEWWQLRRRARPWAPLAHRGPCAGAEQHGGGLPRRPRRRARSCQGGRLAAPRRASRAMSAASATSRSATTKAGASTQDQEAAALVREGGSAGRAIRN